MVISNEQPLSESIYLSKYPIPTKPESRNSPLDLSEMLIVKNSNIYLLWHSVFDPLVTSLYPGWHVSHDSTVVHALQPGEQAANEWKYE